MASYFSIFGLNLLGLKLLEIQWFAALFQVTVLSYRLLGSEPEMNNLEALLLSTACRPTISLQTSLSEIVKGHFGRQVILKSVQKMDRKCCFFL